jgi:hypothetical protein
MPAAASRAKRAIRRERDIGRGYPIRSLQSSVFSQKASGTRRQEEGVRYQVTGIRKNLRPIVRS